MDFLLFLIEKDHKIMANKRSVGPDELVTSLKLAWTSRAMRHVVY